MFATSTPRRATPPDDLRQDDDLFSAVLDGCTTRPNPVAPETAGHHHSPAVGNLLVFDHSCPGSEWASFGLARYPSVIEVLDRPMDDDRFIRTVKNGGSNSLGILTGKRWQRWLQINGHNSWDHPDDEKFQEHRQIKTGLGSTVALGPLQDPVRERSRTAGIPKLHPMPLMRDSPAGPDWRTTDDEGGNR